VKRFLGVLALALLLVLGYAFYQRHQQSRSRVDTSAEDGLAILCGAYDDARAHAQVETLSEVSRGLHRAADSVCIVFATQSLREAESKEK
jgi:hypothetical protein